jgi:hypothetical protein
MINCGRLRSVQRYCQMHGLDFLTPCQIRNRACQLHASRAMTLGCAYARVDKLSWLMAARIRLCPSSGNLQN